MFDFEISTSGGRSLESAINNAIQQGIEDALADLEDAVRSVRCHEHGRTVTARRTQVGGDPAIEIDGCCQEAIDRAGALLDRQAL